MSTQLQEHTIIDGNEVILRYDLLENQRIMKVDFIVYRMDADTWDIKGSCLKDGPFTSTYHDEAFPLPDDPNLLVDIEAECRALMGTKLPKKHILDDYYIRGDLTNIDLTKKEIWQERLKFLTADHLDEKDEPVEGTGYTKGQVDALVPEIVDDLDSEESDKALSAKQGFVLKSLIDSINVFLSSDNVNLDELQEIVDYIQQNRAKLENLHYTNIAGLVDALAGKEPKIATKNSAFNKNFGTASGTVAQGNDSRFHTHSNKSALDGITSSKVSQWDGKAEANHTHTISDIIQLADELENKENILGNPTKDGQVLSSTISGTRSWVDLQSNKKTFIGTYGTPHTSDINIDTTQFSVGDEWIITYEGADFPSIILDGSKKLKLVDVGVNFQSDVKSRIYLHLVEISGSDYYFDITITPITLL